VVKHDPESRSRRIIRTRLPDNLFIGAALAAFDIVLRKSAHAGHTDSSRPSGWNEIPNLKAADA
jgi:hypothetical protein